MNNNIKKIINSEIWITLEIVTFYAIFSLLMYVFIRTIDRLSINDLYNFLFSLIIVFFTIRKLFLPWFIRRLESLNKKNYDL